MSTKKKMYGLKDLEKRLGKMTIAQVVWAWRTADGYSQKDFAKKLGMSPANLCDIEKGRKGVSPEKAEEIAFIIGYSPAIMVKLAIEEQLEAAGLKYEIDVRISA